MGAAALFLVEAFMRRLPISRALIPVWALTAASLSLQANTVCGGIAGNLVANCGFENGFAHWVQQPLTDPGDRLSWAFSGIGIGGTNVSPSLQPIVSFPFSLPANSGALAVGFGGTGQIAQQIAVQQGDTYQVNFYLDDSLPSWADGFCATIGSPTELKALGPQGCNFLTSGGTRYLYPTLPAHGYIDSSFQFTATSSTAWLTFADFPCAVVSYGNPAFPLGSCTDQQYTFWLTTSTPLYPFLLDDVSVVDVTPFNPDTPGVPNGAGGGGNPGVGATPEPGMLAPLLVALGALGFIDRRRITAPCSPCRSSHPVR